MLRVMTLVTLFCSIASGAKGEYLKDSTQNNILDRIVSVIAKDCRLADSTKKELSNYFYSYYFKLRKEQKRGSSVGHPNLSSLKFDFLEGLKTKFGEDVFRCYKKFTGGCGPLARKNNKVNRITEP